MLVRFSRALRILTIDRSSIFRNKLIVVERMIIVAHEMTGFSTMDLKMFQKCNEK